MAETLLQILLSIEIKLYEKKTIRTKLQLQ